MNCLSKYWAIAVTSAKSNLAYAGEIGSRLCFLGIILLIFMQLWKAIFANANVAQFQGYTLEEIIWYLAITECIMLSSPRVTPLIDEDVRTGAITVQLVRPMSYPLYRLASNLGEQAVRFAVTAIAAGSIALLLVGPPSNFGLGLACVLLALPLALVLDFLGYLLVGLFAFWCEDTSGLALIYSRLTMVAGGMLMPLDLFPEAFQSLLKVLPFGYIVSGPARQFVHPDPAGLAALLGFQILWIAVLALVVAFVYSKALKRIALNGG